MKILMLSPLPPPAGGIASWTKLYSEWSRKNKNNIDIINTAVTGSRINNFTRKNLKDELIRSFKIYKEIQNKIKKNQYDLVHINTSCSKVGIIRDYIYIKLLKIKRVKIVLHCHCDTTFMIKGKIAEYFFKKACINSDKIFTLNKASKKHVEKYSKQESIIIPNFIEGKYCKEKQDKIISDQIKNIIYVGHIIPTKGCYEILETAKHMKDINFKMIGYLSEEIKKQSFTDNVEYIGEISKEAVLEQMEKADLLLFPSYTEGFPNVILEAMCIGLPIITTPVGAIPEMIEDKGGIMVSIGSVKEIILAIQKMQDKEVRAKISKFNKKKVLEKYTVDIVGSEISKCYLEI